MDETELRSSKSIPNLPWPGHLPEWATLLLLLALAFVIRGSVLWNTAVPARDGLAYIHYAFRLEQEPISEVLRESFHHPGYPFSILAVSWPVRAFTNLTGSHMTQLSAQLASSLAGWLLVIPMFYLGKRIFNVSVGFWGALLFQCLPSSGHALSDAISEPLFLLFTCSGLLFALDGVQKSSMRCLAVCGAFSGLAYLVRPEGLGVLASCGFVLVVRQFFVSTRMDWRRFFAANAALVVPCLLLIAPYVWTIEGITNKPSLHQMTNTTQTAQAREAVSDASRPLFAAHIRRETPLGTRATRGIKAFALEFAQAYQYVGWIFVLVGVWWCRDRYRKVPGIWVLVVQMLLQTTLVFWLLMKIGYVSQRHIFILVICTIFQAVAVALVVPARLFDWVQSFRGSQKSTSRSQPLSPMWGVGVLLVLVGLGLSRTLQPLHANCEGHYHAGKWLSQHATPSDVILDDHGWARFYAELDFVRGYANRLPATLTTRHFVVYNRASARRRTSHYATYDEPTLQKRDAKAVFFWPREMEFGKAEVVIYQLGQ